MIGIEEALKRVHSGSISADNRDAVLTVLEQHECWDPYLKFLFEQISKKDGASIQDFARLARVQFQFMDNVFAAADTCGKLVDMTHIEYDKFDTEVIPKIIDPEDFWAEGLILQAVHERFQRKIDVIAAVERICFLYEKKVYNERLLSKYYALLIQIDPKNSRALRFFRALHTQNHEWNKVIEVLEMMLEAAKYPQETFRIALEMAAIYVYQLENPQKAIQMIERYCSDSPLDTSLVHFDAYVRLGDPKGCIRVLRQALLGAETSHERAVIHYKLGLLQEQLDENDSARENFAKAVELDDKLLDALESLVVIDINRKNWPSVIQGMELLEQRTLDVTLKNQISEGIKRLKSGLKDVGAVVS